MKPKFEKGQVVKATATTTNDAIIPGSMVSIQDVRKATADKYYYLVRSSDGRQAWFSENSLQLPVGGE